MQMKSKFAFLTTWQTSSIFPAKDITFESKKVGTKLLGDPFFKQLTRGLLVVDEMYTQFLGL